MFLWWLIYVNEQFLFFTLRLKERFSTSQETNHYNWRDAVQRWACRLVLDLYLGGKGKAIPVTGHGGPQCCETLRLPHFLDNQLTEGSEVVSLTDQLPFTPRKIPCTHFCYRLCRPCGHSAAGRIRSTEKSNDLIGNQTRNLPAHSIVPQPIMLPLAPVVPRRCLVKISARRSAIMIEIVLWFSSVPHGKCHDSTLIKPQTLPSKPFPIHHSSVILPFSTIHTF
jgi:hypothetical protein